MSLNSKLAKAI
jgi:hypothetical protein